jgi:hypothetical protein
VRDLENWAAEMMREMKYDPAVRDVSSATELVKRHHELKNELDARKDKFAEVLNDGRIMVENNHFETPLVSMYKKTANPNPNPNPNPTLTLTQP